MPQPAATAAARAAAPPLLPGLQEEGEFVDVDLGGGQQVPCRLQPLRGEGASDGCRYVGRCHLDPLEDSSLESPGSTIVLWSRTNQGSV